MVRLLNQSLVFIHFLRLRWIPTRLSEGDNAGYTECDGSSASQLDLIDLIGYKYKRHREPFAILY